MKKLSIEIRRQIKEYSKNLDNFKTVIKDTNNRVNEVMNIEYNCMGYALGVFDWMNCHSFIKLAWSLEEENPDFEPATPTTEEFQQLDEMTWEVRNELLRRFPVRAIKQPEDANPHERVFALRCGFDDFHFARLNSDGTWTHKPGANTIRVMTEEELYSEAWCDHRWCPYNSSIHFFAMDAMLNLEDMEQEDWSENTEDTDIEEEWSL